MLEEINIGDLGVISDSRLELGPGFTVITGETGAGKTMVVTALGLLLGGRADSSIVRHGSRQARVEGVVDVARLAETAAAVTELGGAVEDDRVVLTRVVAQEGRSRAFAGGASVPVARLAEVAQPLVAVHGQSDQHRLLRPAAQREALDRFAGEALADELTAYQAGYHELRSLEADLAGLRASRLERAREVDLLRFGLDEIDRAAPAVGEDVRLAEQEARLAHADALRRAAEQAREALSSEQDAPDTLGTAAAARQVLDAVRDHDPEAATLADRLAELTYLVSDLAADVASYADRLESDPLALAAASQRRAELSTLTRKYGDTVDDVLAWAGSSRQRLETLVNTDDRIEQLLRSRDELLTAMSGAASRISALRQENALRLATAVTGEVSELAMPHARLAISVRRIPGSTEQQPADPGAESSALFVDGKRASFNQYGIDEVEFLLAANAGSQPRSLARGASGGELSRVMLALEVALADTVSAPTFVFDEVDAGVGGKAAVEVGRRLAKLATAAQVVVVTHLPQVAAYADRHIVVEKTDDGSVTTSGLTVLDDTARERELSRMLAGLEDSETGLEHARELLAAARTRRAQPPGRGASIG
ncbi:MAG: DNA repair protein RecN [Nocardioides sp.]